MAHAARGKMSLNTFEDLFVHKLRTLYSAETQFTEAQSKLAEAASDEELRAVLERHVEVTQRQLERLDQIATTLGVKLAGETCDAAKGLIAESQKIVREDGDPLVKDAGLLAAAQGVEHYEISGYGTASAYARRLGYNEIDKLLQQTLAEERGADTLLSELAEASINKQAAS
jgi:ferritin-like metal-binding protein YciE